MSVFVLIALFLHFIPGGEAAASIAFYHKGIDQGLDPNGNKFDIYEIKDPSLIGEALGSLNLESEMDPENIGKAVSIRPVLPKEILKSMKKMDENIDAKTESIITDGYHPNEYCICLEKIDGVSKARQEEILDALLDVYMENYYDKYFVVQSDLFSLTEERLMGYDYPEMVESLDHEISILANYIHSFKEQDAFFRGVEKDISFGDMEQKILLLKNVDLRKLDSYIGAYKFTKQKDKRIELLKYRIKVEENNSIKNNDEKEVIQSIIEKFKKDTAILFMGADTSPIELENKSNYYNTLVSQYTRAGVFSSNAQRNIEKIKEEIADLESTIIPYDVYLDLKIEIDNMVLDLLRKINRQKEETYALINDYYDKEFRGKMVERVGEMEWR